FVDVVIHLFEPEQRFYYDIEALWKTGARIDWARPGDPPAKSPSDDA
ncbi:MAG: RsfS/YbeB/iojap family protein, partial [Phycisphaeraceae bacterium]|nr:RsfS/YbeB/iojap family protein [Phycisphaeraceae bacterium]